jgi:hypothetical protein
MAGMMALLRATLGTGLGEDIYIVIHEMARNTYGRRGGLSRAERDRRRAA